MDSCPFFLVGAAENEMGIPLGIPFVELPVIIAPYIALESGRYIF
jgi:hypothetical protein